ncbi:hypothetical protein [Gracilimonas sp.]|uniref:hypothetical protein n=1 Tax=Gracilimonas sp. TaxID=1974203 RepID=UPI002870F58C|nr:hypothetical protein [Gracilimonas sp.]
MKNLYILILLFLFAGCSVFENEQSIPLDYTGEWQWIESTGGILGMRIDADSVDYTQTLQILEQNIVKWYLDGELLQEYRAEKSNKKDMDVEYILKPINAGEHGNMIKSILGIQNGNLILMDECADCFIYTFKR